VTILKQINLAVEMAKRLMVDSIWKSANLEGLGTTFPKTEMILENLSVDTSREEVLFIVNMKRAWDFLLNTVDMPNNLAYMRELNKIAGDNLFYGNGEIRTMNVSIGGTSWCPSIPVLPDLYNSISMLETIEDAVEKALSYFCFIARTQMFIDGNKRVAQLIANKVLINAGKGVFQIPVDAVGEFKLLLIQYYESNNDDDIKGFMHRYCVIRVGEVPEKYINNSDPLEYEGCEINSSVFELSSRQLTTFNMILKNIRKLLVYLGGTGVWKLYEEGRVIYLSGTQGTAGYTISTEKLSKQGILCGVSDEKLSEFIVKTVYLLEHDVPLPIKEVKFSVVNIPFGYGKIYTSSMETGSMVVELI
jgi:hypothetical protein